MTLLQTQGLSRRFGGLTAVDQVDFSLMAGEIRAIIGPNGAGKSTFVGLLSGRIAPSAGTVLFDGHDITRLPAHERVRRGIAYTFQITNIYPTMSVRENLAIAAQGRVRRLAQIDTAVGDAARAVDLLDRLEDMAGTLSYGHQRLLEVGMGLALHPRLLILDEPTQGLSDAEITNFLTLVRHVARTATVLLIEHNMDVVMALATRITVLDRGRILAEGPPDAIARDSAVQAAYLGGAV
ncbi:MAG TPA: ABC transporter ATP-binding protein [Paenirhodobacter sp.]